MSVCIVLCDGLVFPAIEFPGLAQDPPQLWTSCYWIWMNLCHLINICFLAITNFIRSCVINLLSLGVCWLTLLKVKKKNPSLHPVDMDLESVLGTLGTRVKIYPGWDSVPLQAIMHTHSHTSLQIKYCLALQFYFNHNDTVFSVDIRCTHS